MYYPYRMPPVQNTLSLPIYTPHVSCTITESNCTQFDDSFGVFIRNKFIPENSLRGLSLYLQFLVDGNKQHRNPVNLWYHAPDPLQGVPNCYLD